MRSILLGSLCLLLLADAAQARELVHPANRLLYDRALDRLVVKPKRGFAAPASLPAPLVADDFRAWPADQAQLGRLLFFDKVLSGNGNIACATCHHPFAATGDGLSLPTGEGGEGFGVTRTLGAGAATVTERVPRNAPPLFNLGARSLTTLFYDGRLAVEPASSGAFVSPAGEALPDGLASIVAAQALLPLTSSTEMAGHPGENAQADAAAIADFTAVWDRVVTRIRAVPEYVGLFGRACDDVDAAADLSIVHVANAIAAYVETAFRAIDSPFDRYLRGDPLALNERERLGLALFFGRAGCSGCHGGSLLTDQRFHAIGMPQLGPGKGDSLPGYDDGLDDFGRERVTGAVADRFRFRTPPLRMVAITAPFGHAGAYERLIDVVRHHLDPQAGLATYDASQATLRGRRDLSALDGAVMADPHSIRAIGSHVEIEPVELTEQELGLLVDFLHALTDRAALDLRREVPLRVPSGLPVRD